MSDDLKQDFLDVGETQKIKRTEENKVKLNEPQFVVYCMESCNESARNPIKNRRKLTESVSKSSKD